MGSRSGRRGCGSSSRVCRGRLGSARFQAPFLSPDGDRVDDHPGPVEFADHGEAVQELLMQPRPQPGSGPFTEPPVDRRAADPEQGSGQLRPRHACLDQVDDRCEHGPVVGAFLPTALPTWCRDGDQRLRDLPEVFRSPRFDHVLNDARHSTMIAAEVSGQPSGMSPYGWSARRTSARPGSARTNTSG